MVGDGTPDFLDLDSDNDGCSDANEYYGSYNADGNISGNDNAMYGTGSPAVDSTGKVTAASYTGTYTSVISVTSTTASVLNTATPADASVLVGGNTSFTTTVTTSGTGTTLHQWQISTDNGVNWTDIVNGGVYTNAKTATLNITGATAAMNSYKYRDVVYQSTRVCTVAYSRVANLCIAPATPTINTTAPTCSADGSSSISNYGTGLTYTFTPTGPTVSSTGAISGMTVGTSYKVTSTNAGNCISSSSASFSNAAMLTVPAAPTA